MDSNLSSGQDSAAILLQEEQVDPSDFYIFGDPKRDRDRQIAQSRIFGDYVQANATRFILESPKRVLDIGCGEGQITTVFSKVYKNAHIIGVDRDAAAIEAAQQRLKRIPGIAVKNIEFVAGDIQEALPAGPFDLIYGSMVFLHLEQPEKVLQLCFENLSPGGYLWIKDSGEFDVENRPAFKRWTDMTVSAMLKMNRKLFIFKQLHKMLEQAGFTDIHEFKEHYDLKDTTLAGRVMNSIALASCYNTIPMLTKLEHVPVEELQALFHQVEDEFTKNPSTANLPNFIAQRS